MTIPIQDANDAIRQAIEVRRERQAAGKSHEEWYDAAPTCTISDEDLDRQIEEHHARRAGLLEDDDSEDCPGCPPQSVTLGYDADTLKDARHFIDALAENRLLGDGALKSDAHPTSQAFYDLCDRLKEVHSKKSQDYGCPSGTDPLANIRNGANFVGIPAWRAAMVRLSDKVTRLATFNATGRLEFEGVEDTLLDLASYALLSLVLYTEETGK